MKMADFDVIIVGAGLSGIGAAYHLQDKCPNKSFVILEGREAIGGTWDLFRYPGIRSDSDMHTLGYNFKPWLDDKAIADGPSIRKYVQETAEENGFADQIRFNHLVKDASWDTASATWTVAVEGKEALSCNFLFMCGGYYSYKGGYSPEFPGADRFQGTVIHPQNWPQDLDYSGKRVAIIGSGATAMTLVPAMAKTASHVTMVQRSPTYVVSRPDVDGIANTLRKFLPEKVAYAITRFKNVQMQRLFYNRSRVAPEKVKGQLLKMVRKEIGDETVEKHFTPSYNPWDERLCLIPNADLFDALNENKASVVTDEIDTFTETGLKMKSGEEIDADIIVTATGLNLVVLNDITIRVDEKKIDIADTFSYKGMMFSGVPNLVQTFGYINASWTLRADLTSEYVCRMLNHMDASNTTSATPRLRKEEHNMEARPWIDDFSPGYMARTMHLLPKQGLEDPWRNTQNYALDKKSFRNANMEDGILQFENNLSEDQTGGGQMNAEEKSATAA